MSNELIEEILRSIGLEKISHDVEEEEVWDLKATQEEGVKNK